MIKLLGYNPDLISGDPHPPGLGFSSIRFSGGEIHVTLDDSDEDFSRPSILADVHDSDDLMELLMVTDALKRSGNIYGIDLILPYVPYGRQDRVANPGESLSFKVFCDIINAQKYDSVEILDPHSEVTTALIDRCVVVPQEELVNRMLDSKLMNLDTSRVMLISPDAGANKKTLKVAQHCGFKGVIRADKVRDTATGQITGTEVYCGDLGDRDVLIVDDLIDGGKTFQELAKVLRTKTTGYVMLYVTHGIFSKGLSICKDFDYVYVYKGFGECYLNDGVLKVLNKKGEI